MKHRLSLDCEDLAMFWLTMNRVFCWCFIRGFVTVNVSPGSMQTFLGVLCRSAGRGQHGTRLLVAARTNTVGLSCGVVQRWRRPVNVNVGFDEAPSCPGRESHTLTNGLRIT